MELQEQFTGFYEIIRADPRISSMHISLYMALLLIFFLQSWENPVSVNRGELMAHAKISARSTYYKCLRDLETFGYIRYTPSHNLYSGSLVYLKRI